MSGTGIAESPAAGAETGSDSSGLLTARGLVREYGHIVAVDGVSLALGHGEFLTIVGPNGAGKTSLLGMLGGVIRPTSGAVSLGGEPLAYDEVAWRSRIGILSHRGYLYAHLTAEENLRFYGRLFGLTDLDDRIREQLEQVGLAGRRTARVRTLSHGMRQRLTLARTLLHDPEVVLLDEPFSGLDPSAAGLLRGVLGELRDGRRTVVMVTHNLREGAALATRIAIQVGGRFAWEGRATEIDQSRFEGLYHDVVESGP